MRLMAIALGLAGFVIALTDTATARDGCGRGWYWNGYACAPIQYAPPPPPAYYGPRYYDEPRVYRGRRHACPPHWEWNPRYNKCTSNYR